MLFPEYNYVGLKSDLRSRTDIVPIEKVPLESQGEMYASIYRFDKRILSHDSLADLGSDVWFYSDYLVFDFDSVDSLDIAYNDAAKLVTFCSTHNIGYETYFSGNKGFHVLIPTCQFGFEPTNDEGILKRMAEAIAARFPTFDTTIYNKTRIFRTPNSLNAKSGLYKIPVPCILELTPAAIVEMAKTPIIVDYPEAWDYRKVEILVKLYDQYKVKHNRTLQATDDPKESYGDWGIIKNAKEGARNSTLYGMSRDLARHGIYERDALIMLGWWNKDLAKPLDQEEFARTVHSAYKKGVNQLVGDDNLFNFCYNSKKALSQIRMLYMNINENCVPTGYEFLDKYTCGGFFKEEVIFIIARPGNFKTALLSNILQGISKTTKRPTLFFSQEMSVESLSIRHIQKAERMTQKEVITKLRNNEDFSEYVSEFKDVFVVPLSSLNTDKVLNILDQFMETYGQLGAIGFDYLSLFEGCANDTARTARMATELKTRVAKAAKCPTFCLVQAKQKYEGVEGDIEIDRTAGKDSSSIEDSGDYVIGIWGHWVDVQNIDPVTGDKLGMKREKQIWGKLLKARRFDGEQFPDLPYFRIDIEKQYMNIPNIRWVGIPPAFNQKEDKWD